MVAHASPARVAEQKAARPTRSNYRQRLLSRLQVLPAGHSRQSIEQLALSSTQSNAQPPASALQAVQRLASKSHAWPRGQIGQSRLQLSFSSLQLAQRPLARLQPVRAGQP
jgi:hypothetical protein